MNKAFLFALATAFIWGFAPIFEKIGINGRIDPFVGVVIRTIPIAIAGVIGLMVMGKTDLVSTVDLKSAVFVSIGGLIAGFAGQIAFYSALKHGEASLVVPVAATYPLVALVISVLFLGEQLTLMKLMGIGLVVGGVALLK